MSNIYNQAKKFLSTYQNFYGVICKVVWKHKQSSCPARIIIFITWNSESNHAQLVQTVYPGEMFVCLASPPGTRGRCTSVHEYTSRFSFQTNKTFCTAAEKKKKRYMFTSSLSNFKICHFKFWISNIVNNVPVLNEKEKL